MKLFSVMTIVLIFKSILAVDDYETKKSNISYITITVTTLKDYIIDGSNDSTKTYISYNDKESDITSKIFSKTTESINEITSKTLEITNERSSEEKTETISYEEDYDENESNDVCSVDLVLDDFSESLLPGDYEETKKLEPKFTVNHLNETITILRRLEEYSKNVSHVLKPIMKRVMPRITDLLLLIDLPPDCMASLARIGQSAQDGHVWAMKFLDSMPSITSGVLEVTSLPLGEYDQCLNIESPQESHKPKIYGQYCQWKPTLPFPPKGSYKYGEPIDNYLMFLIENQFNSSKKDEKTQKRINHFKKFINDLDEEKIDQLFYDMEFIEDLNLKIGGLCLPITCKSKDVEYAINKLIYPITKFPSIEISAECDYKDKPLKYDEYQVFSIVVYAILLLLAMMSTIFELISNKYENTGSSVELFKSFSLISNAKKVIWINNSNKKFSTVVGIRAIFAFYIFIIHAYFFPGLFFMGTRRLTSSAPYKAMTEYKYILLRSINAQQVFFMIGGMMTSYVMLSRLERSKSKFSYFHYVIYRYLRTIFPLVGSILMLYMLPLSGDGPLWNNGMKIWTQGCYKNLKASLLMYSNYYIRMEGHACNFPSWYTSADFQLHVFAPIIILILYNKPKMGCILTLILLVLGSFFALSPKILFGIPHFLEYQNIQFVSQAIKAVRHHFYGIEQHVGNYVLGIFLGYLIRHKPNLYFGGRVGESLIWILTTLITIWGIVWNRDFMNSEYTLTQTELLLWIGLDKYCWTAFWFWLIYMGATGRGIFINKFFSWKGFKVVGNLALEIYLVHCFPIFYRISVARDLVQLTDYYLWTSATFDFLITFALGLILNLLVTSPFTNVVNALLLPQKTESNEKKDEIVIKNQTIDDDRHVIFKVMHIENGIETHKNGAQVTKIN